MTTTVERSPRLGPRYWRLWTAGTISNLGDGVDAAALPLLAASLSRDPRLVAGIGTAFALPWLLFALPAGALVDRLDRRKVMYRANLVRAGLVGTIALLVATDTASMWVLYVVAFALGTCETMFDNAAQAMLPSIVERDLLETANGRQYAAEVVANAFVGPPLGAWLWVVAASLPFWFDSASFLVSALLIASLTGSFRAVPAPGAEPVARRSLRHDIADGLRWLQAHRLLRTLALLLGVMNFTGMMAISTFVLFAQDELGLSEGSWGVLLAAMAVGSVLGGLLGERFSQHLGAGSALVLSVVLAGVLAPLVVGLTDLAWVVAVAQSVSGFFSVVWNIITVSLRQQIIPDHLLGRVNSVYRFLGWGSMPLGALAGGFVADAFGLRAPWLLGAVIVAVALAVITARGIVTSAAIDAARSAAPVRPTGGGNPATGP